MQKVLLGFVIVFSLIMIGWIEKGFPMNPYKRTLLQYDYETRAECQRLNSYRDRKATYTDWQAALICAERYVEDRRRIREQNARIELMEEMSKRAKRTQRW